MDFDEKTFNKTISKVVIEHLSNLFGPTTVKTINLYLKRYNTDLQRVCEEPGKVSEALHMIFEDGAAVLEKELVNAAYGVFGLVPDTSASLEVALESLKASVRNLQC